MEPDPTETEDDQSPVQQGIEIHRQRIANILDRMIEKLCIGCCLQQLGGKVDNARLSMKQYASLMKMGGNVNKGSLIGSLRSVRSTSGRSKTSKKSFSQEYTRDSHTSHMIAILHHNPEILKAVNEIVSTMSPERRKFIDEITEFKDYILEILHTSASAERAYNKQIGQAWVNNEKYKKRNAEMEVIHNSKMYEHSFKINEKKNIIANYKHQIEQSHEVCIDDLHKIINESERAMSKATVASAEQQEILGEDSKNVTNQYQSLLESHLSHEKSLRVKRYKIETVLAGWLAKFDQDIGDLQEQLEEQQDGYNSEKAAFDDLTESFENQTIQYEMLMAEKADEEQRIFDKKRYQFIANRSARIIQRWWRRILSRRWGRKKGKGKGKKGKKK